MKLWRKLAMKGNGRHIKQHMLMQEMMVRNAPRTYPLLDALFKRAGMSYALSQKQQETLKKMVEESNAAEEVVDETK